MWDDQNGNWESGEKQDFRFFEDTRTATFYGRSTFRMGEWVSYLEDITNYDEEGQVSDTQNSYYDFNWEKWILIDETKDYTHGDSTTNYTQLNYNYDLSNEVSQELSCEILYKNESRDRYIECFILIDDEFIPYSNEYYEYDPAGLTIINSGTIYNPEFVNLPYDPSTPQDRKDIIFIDPSETIVSVKKLTDLEFANANSAFKIDSIHRFTYYANYLNQVGEQIYDYGDKMYYFYSDYDGPEASIAEIPFELNANLFPNPTSNYINISVSDQERLPLTFNLFNLNGNLIETRTVLNKERISTNHLSPGIYIYQLHSLEGLVKSGKVVKE